MRKSEREKQREGERNLESYWLRGEKRMNIFEAGVPENMFDYWHTYDNYASLLLEF